MLKASLIGYEPVSMDVMVIDGNIVDIVFKLPLNATVLSNITVEAEREKETMQRLNDVEGTYLIAGVKNEVIELKTQNLMLHKIMRVQYLQKCLAFCV